MSGDYEPIGCAGQVQWNSQCDPAGNCAGASSAAIGCDRGPSGCTTCGMGSFLVYQPPSDPPDPKVHTVVKFTKAGAVICHPGPLAGLGYHQGDLMTSVNGAFPTPEQFIKLDSPFIKTVGFTVFRAKTLQVREEIFERSAS